MNQSPIPGNRLIWSKNQSDMSINRSNIIGGEALAFFFMNSYNIQVIVYEIRFEKGAE
ncbi:hypothetical protein [Halobacillus mangrovi]|uniref:hypothetical protein n=1 Tax=Halobacillus mangrovi TaxID=402384 RepID=UPI003D999E4D